MGLRGKGYLKTTWTYQERPVGSSKLNAWDDRIESALALVHFLLNMRWGGGDGVVAGATADDLKVVATSPEGLSVLVMPGYAYISGSPYALSEALQTIDVTPPVTNPRVDVVQARVDTWDVSVKTGTESPNPTGAPADANCLALANVYVKPGMTCVRDVSDGVNGYIIDVRAMLQ
ncbi:MAG TPA: hypothetical protein PLO62_10550 [Candidatus Hydrogenedentes bacterium]|nr:hypothetical protein [Candidatus Hydrogenedentota bacterium]HOS01435.1 hypothetical protein [Candidatus Hydrogenedentota bacterium]